MNIGGLVTRCLPAAIIRRINAIPLGRRLARGAFWTLAGIAVTRVLRMPIAILLARLMGASKYGELGIVSASIDLFGSFAGLGLGLTATKYVAELRIKDPARAGRIIAFSTVVAIAGSGIFAVIMYAIAPWLADRVLGAPHLTLPVRIGSLALFFSAINGVQNGTLYGLEAFRVMAILQVIFGVLDLPLILGGYYLAGLEGVLWGMTASRFASCLVTGAAMRAEARRHTIPIIFSGWRRELAVVWRFSIPAVLGGVMVVPVNWICSAILVNQPHGYAEMGVYNAANQWYAMITFIPSILGSAFLPILSERMGTGDAGTSGMLKLMMQVNGVLLLPFTVMLSVASPLIMRIYGGSYRDAWATLIVVVWTAAIMGVINPVGDVIAASGRMWIGLLMNTGWAAVFIASTLLLAQFGSIGLGLSRLIAYAVHTIWSLWFAHGVIRSELKRNATVALLEAND